MNSDIIQIGFVRRAHGIRGQVRAQLHDPASRALSSPRLRRVLLGPPEGGDLRAFDITAAHDVGGGGYLLSLLGVGDRDAAEALHGLRLYAARADLPPLEEGEFYLADLVGARVVLPDGSEAGSVAEVYTAGGQDLMVVARPGRPEALVPLPAVVAFDAAARRVEIDPPEGLLDLDQPGGAGAGER